MLGPRRRREVTYNEARLAKQTALEANGLTPVKEGADEDFAPTAMADESSDNSGSEVEEGADNVAGSRKVCSTSMLGNLGGQPKRAQHVAFGLNGCISAQRLSPQDTAPATPSASK